MQKVMDKYTFSRSKTESTDWFY